MPATASRRRSMNEINMVPFIDVMLVLLIIFMVTAPMLTPSSVNVPSVRQKGSNNVPKTRADILIDKNGSIRFKADGNERPVAPEHLAQMTQNWLKNQEPNTPVLISADKTLSYDTVMQTMSALQAAGVPRIALAVSSQ